MLDTLRQDIRYAVRTLGRAPGFTLAAVATLGLGIGATALVFSLVNAMLLRPFPYRDPAALVLLEEADVETGDEHSNTSYPNFLSWRETAKSFESVSAFNEQSIALRVGTDAEHLNGARISANLFQTLGVEPVLGRHFLTSEDLPGGPSAVMLSYDVWQKQLNGARDVIGRTVYVDAQAHTVVGVMPPDFAFPATARIWVPYRLGSGAERGARYLRTVARLRDGVTVEDAEREMTAISTQLAAAFPGPNGGHVAHAVNFQAAVTREIRPVLLILLGAVGFVLLIACANVANLMLSRAAGRDREMAIRSAIGAGGARLIRQLLTESLIIAVLGGAAGIMAGAWWLDLFVSRMPAEIPYWMNFSIDRTVLLFVAAVAVTTSIVFGLAPALQARRADLQGTLKEGRASGGVQRARMRSVFVVSQLAAAIVLLVGALLMVRSFLAMRNVDPGFARSNIVTMQVALPETRYPEDQRVNQLHNRLLTALAAVPGVDKTALVSWFPVDGATSTSNFSVEGIGEVQGANVYNEAVSPDYFDAMGIRIVKGRAFTPQDRAGAPGVVIVNQRFAERYFPGVDPIGKGAMIGAGDGPLSTIVGVVANINERDIDQKDEGIDIYRPMQQAPLHTAALVVRTRGTSASMLKTVREQVRAIDPDIAVFNAQTVEEVLNKATWDSRLTGSLFILFGIGALLLAGVGLYGVIAYSVSQRTHEIGIRIALGASRGDVIAMILRQGARLTGIGLGVGVTIAFFISRVLATLLFGVTTTDPYTFIIVPVLLGSVALVASYLPARRALRVNPITALRSE